MVSVSGAPRASVRFRVRFLLLATSCTAARTALEAQPNVSATVVSYKGVEQYARCWQLQVSAVLPKAIARGWPPQVNELLKQKEELTKERDAQVDLIVQLRTEVVNTNQKLRNAEQEKIAMEHEIAKLRDSIAARKADEER
jgi:hypothetical protein